MVPPELSDSQVDEYRSEQLDPAELVAAYQLPAVGLIGIANALEIPLERRGALRDASLMEPRFLDEDVIDERIHDEDYARLRTVAVATLRALARHGSQKVRLKRQLIAETGVDDRTFGDTISEFGRGDWMWELTPEDLASVLPALPKAYRSLDPVTIARKLQTVIQRELLVSHKRIGSLRDPGTIFPPRPPEQPDNIKADTPLQKNTPTERQIKEIKPVIPHDLPFDYEQFVEAVGAGKLVALVTAASMGIKPKDELLASMEGGSNVEILESLRVSFDFTQRKIEGLPEGMLRIHHAHSKLFPFVYRKVMEIRNGHIRVPHEVATGMAHYMFFMITGYFGQKPDTNTPRALRGAALFLQEHYDNRANEDDQITEDAPIGIAVLNTLADNPRLIQQEPTMSELPSRAAREAKAITPKETPESIAAKIAQMEADKRKGHGGIHLTDQEFDPMATIMRTRGPNDARMGLVVQAESAQHAEQMDYVVQLLSELNIPEALELVRKRGQDAFGLSIHNLLDFAERELSTPHMPDHISNEAGQGAIVFLEAISEGSPPMTAQRAMCLRQWCNFVNSCIEKNRKGRDTILRNATDAARVMTLMTEAFEQLYPQPEDDTV